MCSVLMDHVLSLWNTYIWRCPLMNIQTTDTRIAQLTFTSPYKFARFFYVCPEWMTNDDILWSEFQTPNPLRSTEREFPIHCHKIFNQFWKLDPKTFKFQTCHLSPKILKTFTTFDSSIISNNGKTISTILNSICIWNRKLKNLTRIFVLNL